MSASSNLAITYGYTITSIHTKAQSLLTDTSYNSLHCDTLEDIISKLISMGYKNLSASILSKKDFKEALEQNLAQEFIFLERHSTEKELVSLLNYFIEKYRIINFIYLLSSKESDFSLSHSFSKIDTIGFFQQLNTLKFCTDMDNVYKQCVKNTSLKKYYNNVKFHNDIKENDWQLIQLHFLKQHIEDFYYSIDSPILNFMKDILKAEGDRINVEIVINTMDTPIIGKKRMDLFTRVSSIDLGVRNKLCRCVNLDEMRGVLASHHSLKKVLRDDDIIKALIKIENEKYWESFKYFNDISCVYGYLKLKEQEIKNILWIVECVSMKKIDFIKNVIVNDE